MLQEQVLALLAQGVGSLSGEEMSRQLGVSRGAIWKMVDALRQAGYEISSAPRRGYRLESCPDVLSPATLPRQGGEPVLCLATVDSTSNECKRQAMAGGVDGLVVIADQQTGGRGRLGRSFASPNGSGLYLSLLLRPQVSPQQLGELTAWAAVALGDAIADVTGLTPGIKWPNDLILEGKKVCGILTELSLEGESGQVDYAVLGLGTNLTQTPQDFGDELSQTAISLGQLLPQPPRRSALAAALLTRLDALRRDFPHNRGHYHAAYQARSLTIGRQVRLCIGNSEETAFAQSIGPQFELMVRHLDGTVTAVTAGEVSVRGLLGYV